MALRVIILLACMAGLCMAQTRQRPFEEDDKYWKMKVDNLYDTATLNCTVNGKIPAWAENSTYGNMWLLNNLQFLSDNSTSDGKYTITVDGDEAVLMIANVTRQDFGMYHCIRRRSDNAIWMIKRGLNLQGPYFENLAQKYRNNIIIGISACLGFVAFMVMICLTYQYRWPRLEGRFGNRSSDIKPGMQQNMQMYEKAYDNSTFQVEDGLPVRAIGDVSSADLTPVKAIADMSNADGSPVLVKAVISDASKL